MPTTTRLVATLALLIFFLAPSISSASTVDELRDTLNALARMLSEYQATPSPPLVLGVATQPLCSPTTPPASYHLDSFYKKFCLVDGIPLVSSGAVRDQALKEAALIMHLMLVDKSDVVKKLQKNNVRVGIIGEKEFTTTLPEYRNLNTLFPYINWDTRTRGVGATKDIPLASGAEENLLCLASDVYRNESIFIHEFAHTVKDLGVEYIDSSFSQRLTRAYTNAQNKGRWGSTYAITNVQEYWAEGVQSYFNANIYSNPPNGIHNTISTRTALKTYDPELYALVEEVFPTPWSWSCPSASGSTIVTPSALVIPVTTSAPTCSLTATPASALLDERVKVSWVSTNATKIQWVKDTSGKDNLKPPSTKPKLKGSKTVKMTVLGNPTLTMKVTAKDKTTSTCTVTIPVSED